MRPEDGLGGIDKAKEARRVPPDTVNGRRLGVERPVLISKH